MSEKVHPNWRKLTDSGAVFLSEATGRNVQVSGLDFERAIKIGHALTIALDVAAGMHYYTPRGYPYEQAVAQAEEHDFTKGYGSYSETRPADRNLAVHVEAHNRNNFTIYADLRNAYEDNPELHGERILQSGFINAIESLDL